MAKVNQPSQHVPESIRKLSQDLYDFLSNQRFFDYQIWTRNGGAEDYIEDLQDAVFASTELARFASEIRQIKLQIDTLASESNINLLKAKIKKLSVSIENLEEQMCGPQDLRPLERRIEDLENQGSMTKDLRSIERRIESLEREIIPKINLTQIEKRLSDIEAQL